MTEQRRRRPGRRPGSLDTRGEIITAARGVFAEKGFDKATVRGIAREANVDPALVHHYFDTKEGLFVAAMRFPVEPSVAVPMILAGPREELGERLIRFILTVASDEDRRAPIIAMIRSAMSNEQAATMVREFLGEAVLQRLAQGLGVDPIRIEAAFGQMIGVVMLRYIVKIEPIASATPDELVALLAPTLQRYVDP
ncbi:TetR family transcriptional regulator [Herbidospora sp. NEAU-GS84]|uniref:TetR family transcriptional regulator n=1 Tax=Herbidospora solisilvae TaxID=2696284 RepID=A0A7C9MY53_9ACTN|nr:MULTISPECIES: TetR family transcriptional regulator [Herbidospora]NAS23731.1 TetR family transcriptional regulator [Herbidospora solisilvae]GLX95280.1 TetR family transcriptional regulator [Herbidospora sp. NBRC 101105]